MHNYRSVYEPLVFSDVEVKKRAHRTDYYFQFKSPKYKVAEADLIISIEVMGDIPSYGGHYWKIPDEWRWNKAKITMPKALAMILAAIISLACFIASVWWTVSLFLARIIRWRPVILPGLIFLAVVSITGLNYIPAIFSSYNTTIPVPIYLIMLVVGGLLLLLVSGALMIFGLALADAAIAQLGLREKASYALKSLALWLDKTNTKTQYDFWLDAILIAGAYELFSHIYSLAKSTVSAPYNHTAVLSSATSLHAAVNSLNPVISELAALICMLYAAVLFSAICIGIIAKFGIRKDWQIFLFIVVTTALTSVSTVFISTEVYWQEILLSAIFSIVGTLLYWYFLRKAVWRNVLSLVLWLFIGQMAANLKELIESGWTIIPVDICVLVAVALLPLTYVIYLKARLKNNSASPSHQV